MLENLVPMVVMTGMFAMIFGIVYIRSRENMAMIERGLNPRNKDVRPRPFVNLKWGLLLMGAGMGLLLAYMIDNIILDHSHPKTPTSITFGGHHTKAKDKAVAATDSADAGKDTSMSAVSVVVKSNNNADADDEDEHSITEIRGGGGDEDAAIYFALIAIGGGLGLFLSYRIEKKEWLDKKV